MYSINRAKGYTGSLLLALTALVSVPAFAQRDISGEWAPRFHEDQPERIPGPEIGDYLGLPINDAARLRGDTWDASLLTLPEHQCKPRPSGEEIGEQDLIVSFQFWDSGWEKEGL